MAPQDRHPPAHLQRLCCCQEGIGHEFGVAPRIPGNLQQLFVRHSCHYSGGEVLEGRPVCLHAGAGRVSLTSDGQNCVARHLGQRVQRDDGLCTLETHHSSSTWQLRHLRQVFWGEGLSAHMASKQGLPAALDSNTKRADKPQACDHNPSGLGGRWVPKVVCSHHKAGLLLPTARTARQGAEQLPEQCRSARPDSQHQAAGGISDSMIDQPPPEIGLRL